MSGNDWDARTYDRIADPMYRWGVAAPDRPPRGHVVALDVSPAEGPAFVREVARRMAGFGPRYVRLNILATRRG